MGKWLVRGAKGLAILAVVLAAGAVWKREQITRLLAVNSLFAPEKIVQNFSNMDQLFLTRVLPRGDGLARWRTGMDFCAQRDRAGGGAKRGSAP